MGWGRKRRRYREGGGGGELRVWRDGGWDGRMGVGVLEETSAGIYGVNESATAERGPARTWAKSP